MPDSDNIDAEMDAIFCLDFEPDSDNIDAQMDAMFV